MLLTVHVQVDLAKRRRERPAHIQTGAATAVQYSWCVTVWGCFSFDCTLDLYVLDGNLRGQKYRDNVLAPRVVPHFDNHALADRPMFMDDNARPHRTRIVQHCLQQEAVQTIPWPAMSLDMNPIEHVWDFIGRTINQRNPKCQNNDELRTAIFQEWHQFPPRTA